MPLARNIAADRGLTIRMFMTGLLLVVLYGGFIAILWRIGLSFGLIVFIAFAFLFVQYWFSDRSPCGRCTATWSPRSSNRSYTGSSTACAPWPTCPSPGSPSRTSTCPTPSPPAAARRRPSCARPPACCDASTSPRSRRCSPTRSPTSPTATSPS